MQRKYYIPFGEAPTQSIDYLLGIIEDARVVTHFLTNNISTEELHWQYAEGWNTVGALLSHIISCGHFFRIMFVENRELTKQEEQDLMPGLEMGKYVPSLINDQPIAYYHQKMKEATDLLTEAIMQLSEEEFHGQCECYAPGHDANLAWVLYHLAEDEVHHRGQISLIRKLYRHHKKLAS